MLSRLIEKISIQLFAINTVSFEAAMKYIQEPAALEKTLNFASYTNDLIDDSIEWDGVKYIKYQRIEFGGTEPGTYSFAIGYSKMNVGSTWVTRELTQDIGNTIPIERENANEALGVSIVRVANRYIQRIYAPAIDKYRFSQLAQTKNTFAKALTLTDSNILGQVLHAESRLADAGIDTNSLILYISNGKYTLLKQAALAKGYWSLGNWDGNMEVEVEIVSRSKVVPVPSNLLPNGVQAILLNKYAAPAWVKFFESVFHDKIPGHGNRKHQVDIGGKHDISVYEELSRAIYVFLETSSTKYTVTYAKGNDDATGDAPTETDKSPDEEFVLKANTFTLSGKKFVGWFDGNNLYPAGVKYVMPANNVTLTAVWTDN